MKMEIVKITPEQAKSWLDSKNYDNRNLRQGHVLTLSKLLRTGQWRLTPDAIAFDTNHRLINGQHRLHAIVKAEKPATAWVATGMPENSYDATDQGVSRNVGDLVKTKDSSVKSAGAKGRAFLMEMELSSMKAESSSSRIRWAGATKNTTLSRSQIAEMVVLHDEILARSLSMVRRGEGDTLLRPVASFAGVALHLLKIDDNAAAAFFSALTEGTVSAKQHPIFQLRRILIQDSARRAEDKRPLQDRVALMLRSWNLWIRHKKIQRLTLQKGGRWPVAEQPAPSFEPW